MGLQLSVQVTAFPSFGYISVELLDHIVCLLFWGITIPFSKRAAPVLLIHSHWQCTRVLISLHPCQCLFLSAFSFLNNTHPYECEAVSHGFDFFELSIYFSCLLSWCFFCLFVLGFFFWMLCHMFKNSLCIRNISFSSVMYGASVQYFLPVRQLSFDFVSLVAQR